MHTITTTEKYTKRIHPPFSYFGSKNRLASKLCQHLPPHHCWVEAFCGSAALTLAKPPALIEVINDLDNEIFNLFEQLKNNHEELCRLIALTPYAAQELVEARKEAKGLNDLERARVFLVQSMMAVNAVFGKAKGGFSFSDSYTRNNKESRVSRWYNLPDRLFKVAERLRSVRVENRDGRALLKQFVNRPATLMYLDPPYLADRAHGYKVDACDSDFHEELLELANKAGCMLFISGYESELYNTILSHKNGWSKKTITVNTKGTNGTTQDRREVVWMNKHFTSALEKNRVPVSLTQAEIKDRHVNPERG